jgi:hypothetical protein
MFSSKSQNTTWIWQPYRSMRNVAQFKCCAIAFAALNPLKVTALFSTNVGFEFPYGSDGPKEVMGDHSRPHLFQKGF